jgi:hypothetical protein
VDVIFVFHEQGKIQESEEGAEEPGFHRQLNDIDQRPQDRFQDLALTLMIRERVAFV